MPQLQSLEVQMSAGADGGSMETIKRVQNVSVGANLDRTNTKILGRFKSLNDRPITNFTAPQFSVACIKSSKEVETNWGILNSTGVGVAFLNKDGVSINGYSARNISLLVSPIQASNYQGQINLYSGTLTSYNVSASVGETARMTFAGEALDWNNTANNSSKTLQNYSSDLVIPENVRISGIEFSGYGLSGITIQSFDLSLSFQRQSAFRLGQRLPVARVITDVNSTLSLRGFFEGIQLFTGFSTFNCGQPYTGTFYFTLQPGCDSSTPGTTYTVVNPYLDSIQIGSQIGTFTSVDLQFSIPISVNSGEAITGSNLIIT